MKRIDLDVICGAYATKWGLTDFYPEAEKVLRHWLNRQEDFETDWFGCKKEIHYARYSRKDGRFIVEVSVYIDDLWESEDLIYDALDSIGMSDYELSDGDIDCIREMAIDEQIDDHIKTFTVLTCPVTFETLVEATNKLEGEAMSESDEMFERLCELVKEYMKYIDNNEEE